MKRVALVAVFCLAGLTAAIAADRAIMYKAPSMYTGVPVHQWTGFYAGAHVGYVTGHTTNNTNGVLPDAGATYLFAGLHGGYRHQFANNMVLGFQIAAPLWADKKAFNIFGFMNHVDPKYAILGQVQLGYALGRFLPYLTAGMGAAKIEAWEVTPLGIESLHVHNTHRVYALGFGMKFAVTENVAVGIEYNHTWTSREVYNCGPVVCGVVGAFDMRGDSVAGSVEYLF